MAGERRDQRHIAVHMLENDAVDLAQILGNEGLQMIERRVFLGRLSRLLVKIDDLSQNIPFLTPLARAASMDLSSRSNILITPGNGFAPFLSAQKPNLACGGRAMVELLRLNDLVKLSFLEALLRDGGIESYVFDQHMSVLEGSASAIPRRLMVADDDAERARFILRQAEELDGLA